MKNVIFLMLFVGSIAMIAVSCGNKPSGSIISEPVTGTDLATGEPGTVAGKTNGHYEPIDTMPADEAAPRTTDSIQEDEIDYARLRIKLTDNGFEAYYADKALPRAPEDVGLTSSNFETMEAYFAYMDALAASEVPSVLVPGAVLHNNPTNEYGGIDEPAPIAEPVTGIAIDPAAN